MRGPVLHERLLVPANLSARLTGRVARGVAVRRHQLVLRDGLVVDVRDALDRLDVLDERGPGAFCQRPSTWAREEDPLARVGLYASRSIADPCPVRHWDQFRCSTIEASSRRGAPTGRLPLARLRRRRREPRQRRRACNVRVMMGEGVVGREGRARRGVGLRDRDRDRWRGDKGHLLRPSRWLLISHSAPLRLDLVNRLDCLPTLHRPTTWTDCSDDYDGEATGSEGTDDRLPLTGRDKCCALTREPGVEDCKRDRERKRRGWRGGGLLVDEGGELLASGYDDQVFGDEVVVVDEREEPGVEARLGLSRPIRSRSSRRRKRDGPRIARRRRGGGTTRGRRSGRAASRWPRNASTTSAGSAACTRRLQLSSAFGGGVEEGTDRPGK